MPSPTKGPRLGGGPAHERLILANLATSLFEHDQITTTHAKAKRLRPVAERLITFAKRGDLHSRRRVMRIVRDKGVVHRLFTEIAPDVAQRPGGYTRIVKIGQRKGDNAPMAVIELIREPYSPKQATVKEAEAATKRASRGGATAAAAAPAAAASASPAEEPIAPPEDAADSVLGSDAPTESPEVPAGTETTATDATTADSPAQPVADPAEDDGVDTPVAAEAPAEPELAAADEAAGEPTEPAADEAPPAETPDKDA